MDRRTLLTRGMALLGAGVCAAPAAASPAPAESARSLVFQHRYSGWSVDTSDSTVLHLSPNVRNFEKHVLAFARDSKARRSDIAIDLRTYNFLFGRGFVSFDQHDIPRLYGRAVYIVNFGESVGRLAWRS